MQNIHPENLLLIDIETVPQYATFEEMDDNWAMLWEEKVCRSLPEGISIAEFYPQRAGIMAEFAKVICISIGYFRKQGNNLQLRVKSFYGDDEKKLLQDFTATLVQMETGNNNWYFSGHNIKEFDVPFICRRLLINGLVIPSSLNFQNRKPWETNIIDTFQYWRFGDYKNYTSLQLLAAALHIPSSKDDMDGSMVGKVYWQEKNLTRIVTYCQKDVVVTANILLRFLHLPLLLEDQILIVS